MEPEEDKLRNLLTAAAEKEKRAYRRATVFTAIPVLVGIVWLSYSGYKVVKLERQSQNVTNEIRFKTDELNHKSDEIKELEAKRDAVETELAAINHVLSDARATLVEIAQGQGNVKRQAKNAQAAISSAQTRIGKVIGHESKQPKQANESSPTLQPKPASESSLTLQPKRANESDQNQNSAAASANQRFLVLVPNVVGLDKDAAVRSILSLGLQLSIIQLQDPPNSVVVQRPKGGTRVPRGTRIELVFDR
jgi:hypothetical protein